MKRNLLLEYRVRKLEKLVLEKATGTLPKYFYHGTTRKNAERIKNKDYVLVEMQITLFQMKIMSI